MAERERGVNRDSMYPEILILAEHIIPEKLTEFMRNSGAEEDFSDYLGEPIDEDFMRLLESKLSPQELTEVLEDSLRRNFLVASNEINYLLKNFWVVDNKVA